MSFLKPSPILSKFARDLNPWSYLTPRCSRTTITFTNPWTAVTVIYEDHKSLDNRNYNLWRQNTVEVATKLNLQQFAANTCARARLPMGTCSRTLLCIVCLFLLRAWYWETWVVTRTILFRTIPFDLLLPRIQCHSHHITGEIQSLKSISTQQCQHPTRSKRNTASNFVLDSALEDSTLLRVFSRISCMVQIPIFCLNQIGSKGMFVSFLDYIG